MMAPVLDVSAAWPPLIRLTLRSPMALAVARPTPASSRLPLDMVSPPAVVRNVAPTPRAVPPRVIAPPLMIDSAELAAAASTVSPPVAVRLMKPAALARTRCPVVITKPLLSAETPMLPLASRVIFVATRFEVSPAVTS